MTNKDRNNSQAIVEIYSSNIEAYLDILSLRRAPRRSSLDFLDLKSTAFHRTYGAPKGSAMTASASRPTNTPQELKKERIELRVAPSAKALILRAAAVSGLTAGDLAYEGARRVLDEHERMLLTGADRDVFLEAVRAPPPPASRLVEALRRHRDEVR
jgi:uncharacterized protein (DUF1778 family)